MARWQDPSLLHHMGRRIVFLDRWWWRSARLVVNHLPGTALTDEDIGGEESVSIGNFVTNDVGRVAEHMRNGFLTENSW